jgi:acyl-coenzyme A synthetase/AMP-(fatty) acid ligase
LREATYQQWKAHFGCEIYEHYGVSEFQLVVGQGPRHPVKPGSVGKPAPGVGIIIAGEDGRPVRPAELGRAVISTADPGLFIEYYGDRERTDAAFRHGFYDTGDLAYQDAEGYFYIAGRSDDCFKSRGLFIAPTEVENAIQRNPAVAEAAVVPEPDPEIGNKVIAFVALREGFAASAALEAALRKDLRDAIAHFKVPHRIVFMKSLPKSAVGKLLRSALLGNKNVLRVTREKTRR